MRDKPSAWRHLIGIKVVILPRSRSIEPLYLDGESITIALARISKDSEDSFACMNATLIMQGDPNR